MKRGSLAGLALIGVIGCALDPKPEDPGLTAAGGRGGATQFGSGGILCAACMGAGGSTASGGTGAATGTGASGGTAQDAAVLVEGGPEAGPGGSGPGGGDAAAGGG